MEKIINLFRLKNYAFSTKVIVAFFIIIIMFSVIRTILTLPKIQEKNEKEVIDYVSRTLNLMKHQFYMRGKSLKMQSQFETELFQEKITHELKSIEVFKNKYTSEELIKKISNSHIINQCKYQILFNNQSYNSQNKDDIFKYNNQTIIKKWTEVQTNELMKSHRKKKYFFYNYPFKRKNILISIGCKRLDINPNHLTFERSLETYMHTKFLQDKTLPSSKTAVFSVDSKMSKYLNEPLYKKSIKENKNRYNVNRLSNVNNIPTGSLTLGQMLSAEENIPIEHEINGERVLTWILNLTKNTNQSRYFFLAHTIDKKEIQQRNNAGLSFLLTETLIAIGLSFLIILLLLKKTFTKVDTITNTAQLVSQGRKNIRCNIKGDDDIGILGEAFDSMLDRFETSIQTLDKKVEEKTKEITQSLEEKEILLKEIHHRVKNNLALTIGLLELQEEEVQDSKTKKVLVEIQERIFTMELLHRKLYESSNINDIPFKEYVMDLVQAIARTYDMNKEVKVDIVMKALQMNIEKAMPFGLVLNELVTNAFKYAFKENPSPELLISICEKNEQLIMTIQDNGKGLQKSFEEIQNNTLGLKLISTIVRHQLFGEIVYAYDKGAKFIITSEVQNA